MRLKYIKLFEDFSFDAQKKIDAILDKISKDGYESLSDEEKKYLATQEEDKEDVKPSYKFSNDNDEDDDDDDKNSGEIRGFEIHNILPLLNKYELSFSVNFVEDGQIDGGLNIVLNRQPTLIYGNISIDEDFNYNGYEFITFDENENEINIFDKDETLSEYIDTYFKYVVEKVKDKLHK